MMDAVTYGKQIQRLRERALRSWNRKYNSPLVEVQSITADILEEMCQAETTGNGVREAIAMFTDKLSS